MLAAYILSHKLHPARIAGVYTFDQPRIFDAGARASYDVILRAATWRVVNGGDIVPQVPFWHWGYRHAGRKCFCRLRSGDSGCGLLVNPRWDVTVVSKLNAYAESVRRRKDVLIEDHFITDIQMRLAQEEALRNTAGAESKPRLSIPYHNMISIFAQDVLRCRHRKCLAGVISLITAGSSMATIGLWWQGRRSRTCK